MRREDLRLMRAVETRDKYGDEPSSTMLPFPVSDAELAELVLGLDGIDLDTLREAVDATARGWPLTGNQHDLVSDLARQVLAAIDGGQE